MPVEFKHATLDNGLNIVAEVDPDAHTAAAGFFVKTGARDEAPEVMGVSHFLEHMMFKGTDRRTAEDVNREFDEMGARYNAFTSTEMTVFYASVLPERLAQADDLLADILRPSLRTEDFNVEKGVILEEIAMYMDQPFWGLYERASEERYGGRPLGHRVLGTKETITNLAPEQMRTYFKQRYSADNTTVAMAGRLEFDAAVDQIRSLCGGWERTGATRKLEPQPGRDMSFTMTDERVSRCYQLLLTPAPAMQDGQRYAAAVLAQVLGDHDNGRLHWALIEPGLADEAQAMYDAHDGAGDFLLFVSCDPDRADEVWGIVEKELDALRESLTEDDLERVRAKVATGATLAGERPAGRMQRLGRLWTYLGDYIPLEEEVERIKAVSLDDLRALCDAFPMRPRTVGRLTPERE